MSPASDDKTYRVAVLIDVAGLSGSARVALQHCSLVETGFELTLLIISRDNNKLSELLDAANKLQVHYKIIQEKSLLDVSVFTSLYKIFKLGKFNLIESNHYKTHLLALILSKTFKIPWVAVSHGWTSENVKIKIYNCLDSLSLCFASINIAMSQSIASKIKSKALLRTRTIVVPTALDPRLYMPGSDLLKSDLKLLSLVSIGRLSYEKGFDLLLEACALLKNTDIDFKLNIIGTGPELEKLQKLSNTLGLQQKVLFSGQLHSTEVQSAIQSSDCLIISSRSEGLPNTLLEAMWFKTPVISSTVGEIAAVLKNYDKNLLVKPNDSKLMAESIKYFYRLSHEQRKKLSESLNKQLNKKHLAQKRARKIFRIYRTLIKTAN